ncbi:MAG: single-stranded DNA-binding protein [Marivivens sp.]|nr:single-stranded DNA-binding protein [Marivivens sp.]NCW67393.1 single-stranded DNA-binding protein [Marivivens sp.]NDH01722.1 single-stranded DNA-binding protein [Marivivens sp.]
MPAFNKVFLMGNLTRDPEMKQLPSGMAVCDIGMAVNDRVKNKQTGEYEDRANFVDCTAFGKTAENIVRFFTKGRPIFIEGKLRFEQWDDRESGKKRSKIKVVIDTWQFVDSKDQQNVSDSNYPQAAATQDPPGVTVPDDDDIPF